MAQSPEQLIQKIKTFLKKEKEMYGDFSLAHNSEEVTDNKENNEKGSDEVEGEVRAIEPGQIEKSAETESHPKTVEERLEACKTLEELRELCQESDLLKTDLEGTNLVFGVGNPNADLMVIGEAPGEDEDRQGEPFVGKAGQLLNKILAAIDFSRDDIYIANILKHRPPNNRDPKPEERERSLPFLVKQIELIKPKLILSLGKVSAQTLLNSDQSLGRMRGKFHPFLDKYELLATYHPAALLRHSKWKRPTWEDVQMLRKRYDELGCKP
ncbi:uracil-DNA glycosylase [Aliifodinibius sp. S!AR15-10]|uniref:uracil-DNA glycosylase n=1 Tax=Aliifodinibius sp. S!AR15-10 TaxID=2950437 RepID=UPI0028551158|nr:uracil-DNA glycosylase [Aliifodinibius sp. S!AR15-10]MDR8392367.1 uracil-DNA glycosylase [Aliifodinibius sp. S!AR15-10]